MAGIVEQPHAAPLQPIAKFLNGLFHFLHPGILLKCNGKAEFLQRGGHIRGIVDGVLQGTGTVCAVTDDESYALLGSGLGNWC